MIFKKKKLAKRAIKDKDFALIKDFFNKSEGELNKQDIDYFYNLCGPIGRMLMSVYARAGKICLYNKEELLEHFKKGMEYYQSELATLLEKIDYDRWKHER